QAKAPDITEADAKKFYESNPKEFQQPETVKASHILFMVDEGASEEVVNSKKAAAEKAAGRAAKGEDFTALAKELSEEPGAAETGGDLGFFPKDRMVPEFADAAFSQKVGEVGQPVKTQFGWHVIKVTDKRDAGEVPFAEVKDQIAAYLKNTGRREAEQNVIKKLRESAKVETFIPSAS
ncbi:MAG: peptidylprolyl isomerase, partial [Terrimicrobiaceae bacterium]